MGRVGRVQGVGGLQGELGDKERGQGEQILGLPCHLGFREQFALLAHSAMRQGGNKGAGAVRRNGAGQIFL